MKSEPLGLNFPCVINSEYGFEGNLRGLFLCQLATPCDTLVCGSALARIVILHVAGSLHSLRTPLVPTLWTNLTGQLAVHEQRIAVVAPRTSEIDLVDTLVAADTTIIKYVPVRDVLWCRGSSDIRIGLAEYLAVFEPCRRGTKDEVGSALDIAVLEVETRLGITCIDGVLMTQETAIDERQAVTLGMQGHSLSQAGGIILNRDILQRNLAALNLQGKGAESTKFWLLAVGCWLLAVG